MLPRAQPAIAVIIPEQEMTNEVDQIKGVSSSYDTSLVAQVKTEVKLKGKMPPCNNYVQSLLKVTNCS